MEAAEETQQKGGDVERGKVEGGVAACDESGEWGGEGDSCHPSFSFSLISEKTQ